MPFAGQRILAQDFTPTVQSDDQTTINNIASSTPDAGSPVVDLTFVAPTSGKVLVTLGARQKDDSGGGSIIFDYRLYLGTSTGGTLILDTGNFVRRMEIRGNSTQTNQNLGKTSLVSGLTAGATYYVRMLHYRPAGSDTADIVARLLLVQPLPA